MFKDLNLENTIKDILPKIIDAFSEYYGEDARPIIEEKFKNMLIISYGLLGCAEEVVNEIKFNLSNELINNFFNEFNIEEKDRMNLKNILFYSKDENYIPLEMYIDYKESKTDSENYGDLKELAVKFLNNFNTNVTLENIDELEKKGAFLEIDKFIPVYKKIISAYCEKEKELNECVEDSILHIKRYEELNNKYMLQLLKEFSFAFSGEDQKEIEKAISKNYADMDKMQDAFLYLGRHILSQSIYSSINPRLCWTLDIELYKEVNDKLYRILRCTAENIIEFFNKLGIYLGDNFDDYFRSNKGRKIFDDVKWDVVSQIDERRIQLAKQFLTELYVTTKEYQENRKKINLSNLLIEDDGYDEQSYIEKSKVCANIRNGKLFTIMYLNFIDEYSLHDCSIISLFNQIFQSSIKIEGIEYKIQKGWYYYSGSLNLSKDIQKNRREFYRGKYGIFDQCIEELIAKEITKIMHNNKNYILDSEDSKKLRITSKLLTSLVSEFYDTYKSKIIQSRKEGNMQIIFDSIGKENFDALNELLFVAYEQFGELKYLSVVRDLVYDRKTKKVQLYNKLLMERDNILNRMKNYALNCESENKVKKNVK